MFYRPDSKTAAIGKRFFERRGGRLAVTLASEGHCDVPAKRLRELLRPPALGGFQEAEEAWARDEWNEGYLDTDELNLVVDEYATRASDDEARSPYADEARS